MTMSVVDLMCRLRRLDVTIRLDGAELRVGGPRGALPSELLDELRERKPEIIEFLRTFQGQTGYERIPCVEQRDCYPLSHAQRRLWVLAQFENERAAYNIPGAFLLKGLLDIEALKRAFLRILQRHESLRTSIVDLGAGPVQVINENCSCTAMGGYPSICAM